MASKDPAAKPPDIADASMAYMPKPSGMSEGVDEIKLNNKAEETKSMADIAEELGKDKITAPTSAAAAGVAVPVNGKPREVKKSAPAKGTDKIEKPSISHVAPMDELASGDELMSGSDLAPIVPNNKSKSKSAKGKAFFMILALIGLASAGALGYLWYQERQQVNNLQSQVAQSTQGKTSPSPSVAPISNLRTIPELGLMYPLGAETETITYRYRQTIDTDKKVHDVITLSSTKVVIAEREVSNAAPKCTAEFGPLGSIASYLAGEKYKGAAIETQAEGSKTIVKLGEKYYVFETAQAACSSDKAVQAVVAAEKTNVDSFFASLKVKE